MGIEVLLVVSLYRDSVVEESYVAVPVQDQYIDPGINAAFCAATSL